MSIIKKGTVYRTLEEQVAYLSDKVNKIYSLNPQIVDESLDENSTNPVQNKAIASEITLLDLSKQDNLTFDNVPVENSNNPVKSGGLFEKLSEKQNSLTFDNVPVENSNNPVKSGGLFDKLSEKQDNLTFDNVPQNGSLNPVRSDGIYNSIRLSSPVIDSIQDIGSGIPLTVGANTIFDKTVNANCRYLLIVFHFDLDESLNATFAQSVGIFNSNNQLDYKTIRWNGYNGGGGCITYIVDKQKFDLSSDIPIRILASFYNITSNTTYGRGKINIISLRGIE